MGKSNGEVRGERVFGDTFLPVRTERIEVTTDDGQPLVVTRKRAAKANAGIPVVLLHGLGQNRFSWHMESMSMALGLVEEGFDVYLAELRGHGLSGEAGASLPSHFDDYVFSDLPAILSRVRQFTGKKKPFLAGHSLGGTIAYAMDEKTERNVAGIVSIAGPYEFGRGVPIVRALSIPLLKAYDALGLERLPKPKPPITFHTGWVAPLLGLPLFDRKWFRFPVALWVPGSMEKDVLRERLVDGFDRTGFEIVKTMVLWAGSGRFVDQERTDRYERNMASRSVPMLFVTGDADNGVPAESVRPGFELAGSADKTWMALGEDNTGYAWGHLDLVFGKNAPNIVWPKIAAWMKERAG